MQRALLGGRYKRRLVPNAVPSIFKYSLPASSQSCKKAKVPADVRFTEHKCDKGDDGHTLHENCRSGVQIQTDVQKSACYGYLTTTVLCNPNNIGVPLESDSKLCRWEVKPSLVMDRNLMVAEKSTESWDECDLRYRSDINARHISEDDNEIIIVTIE